MDGENAGVATFPPKSSMLMQIVTYLNPESVWSPTWSTVQHCSALNCLKFEVVGKKQSDFHDERLRDIQTYAQTHSQTDR